MTSVSMRSGQAVFVLAELQKLVMRDASLDTDWHLNVLDGRAAAAVMRGPAGRLTKGLIEWLIGEMSGWAEPGRKETKL